MESALVVLVIVVTLVAIDAIGRLDERRQRTPPADHVVGTHRIVVDLTDRDRDSRPAANPRKPLE